MQTRTTILERIGKSISYSPFVFYFLSFSWGLLFTMLGYLLLLLCLPFGKVKVYGDIIFLEFNKPSRYYPTHYGGTGFSLGNVFFVSKNPENSLLKHQLGRCVQYSMLGPLMIFFVMIPMFIRFIFYKMFFDNKSMPFRSMWHERLSDYIGNRYEWYMLSRLRERKLRRGITQYEKTLVRDLFRTKNT